MPHDAILTRDAPVDDVVLTRTAAIEPNSFNEPENTVRVIFSTGADVPRAGHIERLSLDPQHVHLDGLRGASVLDSHQRAGLRNVIGVVGDASVDGQAGHATIRLSRREDVAGLVSDIRDGVIRHVSIGYRVNKWRDSTGPAGERIRTAIDWEPHEISFVAVGADPGAHVRSDPGNTYDRAEINTQIRTLGRTAGLTTEFVDSLIDRNLTVEQARAAAFDELTRNRPRIPAYQLGISGDDPATIRERMAAALAHRLGVPGELAADAVPYRGMGLHDMARSLLATRGEPALLTMPVEQMLQRAITTSDLPVLLQSTGNRSLMAAYTAAASPLRQLARQSTAQDFRAKTALRVGTTGLLERVAEHGEIKHGGVTETKETYSIDTFAKIWALTRQALINDDLGAFADMSNMMGRAAAETEASLLVGLLIPGSGLGPMMDDGITLFDTLHGNESASGAAPAAATLAAGVEAMRVQKGLDNDTPINAVPLYLLVSPAKEFVARQAVASFYPATSATTNPLAGTLTVLVEPRLTGNRWYLFADPGVLPVLEFSYLSSAPGPQMQSREGFDVLGMEFRVVLDYGAGVLDWRGAYTNAGA
jgi:hypothetical protein